MDSNVGLAIQCVGILLVTLLSFFMMRSIQSAPMRYWTIAWSCLTIALASLYIGFHQAAPFHKIFYTLYFLGEYLFGFMFVAGCHSHATGEELERKHLFLLIPFALIALVLPHVSDDFNLLFIVQALLMSGFFTASFLALRPARKLRQTTPGVRVMTVALVLLALDFLHYVPVFGSYEGAWGFHVPQGYLQYTSIFDLILEILLGFGTMMVLMEGMRREVEVANRELTDARDRLEFIARVDPLTEALNRHAFHSLLSKSQAGADVAATGCVAVIDINNLKPINDTLGHAVGDMAIRSVARAVRSLIRADDMLFRWGGDEFLLLMFGMPETEAQKRLDTLNKTLAETTLHGVKAPVRISVSHGLCCFMAMTELERAIEQADGAMYRRKQLYKAQTQSVEKQGRREGERIN
ncbi:MAG TPA: GGDEF domain-containing protein [Pyrinomonadaceae bacterium]